MQSRRKPLREQTMVLTGATSGIGLVTARVAAEGSAQLVLAARDEEALRQLTQELCSRGRDGAACCATDVRVREQVERLASFATSRFGGFDTWINNAGDCMFGQLLDVSLEDAERVRQTNFGEWSTARESQSSTCNGSHKGA